MTKSSLTWRSTITSHFSPEIAAACPITVVTDPDELLLDEQILSHLAACRFDLIVLDDTIRFRFLFETKYRHTPRAEQRGLVIRVAGNDPSVVPFDFLSAAERQGRILGFSVAELFRELDPQVIRAVPLSGLDRLHAACQTSAPKQFGTSQTTDFVLRHVFEIVPELIKTPVDLLRTLLQRHYRGEGLPTPFAEAVAGRLQHRFADWPVLALLSDRDRFFSFLGERWPRFVHAEACNDPSARPMVAVPADLPFGHEDIRVYIDNLFLEGHLAPYDGVTRESLGTSWARIGVAASMPEDKQDRLSRLLDRINPPDAGARRDDWLLLAQQLGECLALRRELHTEPTATEINKRVDALADSANDAFANWLLNHYGALSSLPYFPSPVMVHHIPHFMAHGIGRDRKRAIIVVDGMAIEHWRLLRDSLISGGDRKYALDERAAFAWIPTLTSVSRQAIFSGEPPVYFADSISTTSKEPNLWIKFWEDRGLARRNIAYLCYRAGEPDESINERLTQQAADQNIRVVGLVLGFVDQTMHGVLNGSYGLHAAVKAWANARAFKNAVDILLDNSFEILVTADHGNTEAVGFGKPNAGVTAEERGERVHIFSDDILRSKHLNEFAGAIAWPTLGLPDDFLALMAPTSKAFKTPGTVTVGHGGITLQEVVVPLIKIGAGA